MTLSMFIALVVSYFGGYATPTIVEKLRFIWLGRTSVGKALVAGILACRAEARKQEAEMMKDYTERMKAIAEAAKAKIAAAPAKG